MRLALIPKGAQMSETVTAAVLIIGNEILSGRTQDLNMSYLGTRLNELGIQVREARVVADDESEIVAALNTLRTRYDYLFTTGGIGPTHDDITADSVAKAFGVGIDYHPQAYQAFKDYFEETGLEANEARMRMARVPDGAALIDDSIEFMPGFQMENVFVLAGVPSVAREMFEGASKRLRRGTTLKSRSIKCHTGEGAVAGALGGLQKRYPDVDMGSYPWTEDGRHGTTLVLRSRNPFILDESFDKVFEMVEQLGGGPLEE